MLCKVMERLIANRLMWYLETHNILTNVQTGFRKKRSTIDQIIRVQDTINRSLRNRSHTLGIFLDFGKAFDMMWRTGLLIKFKKIMVSMVTRMTGSKNFYSIRRSRCALEMPRQQCIEWKMVQHKKQSYRPFYSYAW